MSAIFPYVGFNYSSSAPCLGGLPILRSPKKLSGQGIREAISRRETGSEQNGLALGSGNDPEQTAAPLDENPAEVSQAGTKHDEGIQRLSSIIRNNLGRTFLTGVAVLTLLSSCAFDEYSKRAQNAESARTQGVVQPYVGNGELGVYVPFWATDVPHVVNGRNFQDSDRTPIPIELQN